MSLPPLKVEPLPEPVPEPKPKPEECPGQGIADCYRAIEVEPEKAP